MVFRLHWTVHGGTSVRFNDGRISDRRAARVLAAVQAPPVGRNVRRGRRRLWPLTMPPHMPTSSNDPEPPVTRPLEVRELEEQDVGKGFCELLGQLTTVGEVSEAQFASRWAELNASEDYKIVVVEDTASGKLVGCATLFIEKKFIHGCGKVGHVEDVVVDSTCRGQKLGLRLINALSKEAAAVGCYKIILDCSEHNVPFYEKCGYERKGAQMAKYFE